MQAAVSVMAFQYSKSASRLGFLLHNPTHKFLHKRGNLLKLSKEFWNKIDFTRTSNYSAYKDRQYILNKFHIPEFWGPHLQTSAFMKQKVRELQREALFKNNLLYEMQLHNKSATMVRQPVQSVYPFFSCKATANSIYMSTNLLPTFSPPGINRIIF